MLTVHPSLLRWRDPALYKPRQPARQVALATAGDSDVQALQDAYVRSGGASEARSASHTGLIVLLVCLGLAGAAGGAFAWFRFGRPHLARANRSEYVSMAALEDGADYRPPQEEAQR